VALALLDGFAIAPVEIAADAGDHRRREIAFRGERRGARNAVGSRLRRLRGHLWVTSDE